ncbi:MAG TPA: DUF4153 domain-containing protein [Dokdonella sp.]|uniref:DUF4153 domain-containing protein n=1 Tax=Dokdonella sp. TaxID=2291710 RepID=UPI002CF0A7F9|nr:DUF4153 domain-containing protein [Dokdonella sp.]HUD42805.1 DUF4153 domain-containing protein [Dokdonella sp.]
MSTDTVLGRAERQFIVLVSLLQGFALYLVQIGEEHGWWPFSLLGGRVCWYTLVLAVPGAMTLSVLHLRDRRFWQHALGLMALLALPASWAAWSATGAPGLDASEVLGPYGVSTALAVFLALPYLQCRLTHGRWCAPYPELFGHVWQNGLTLAVAGLFTGIGWLVLHLWASLFALIDITFFRELFRSDPFEYLATGALAGLGILIGRTQHRAIRTARQVVVAIAIGLLPLIACVAVLFVASLPFTGLDALWNTRSATFILMSVIAASVLGLNAVWQDGTQPSPYPAWLRRVIEAGVLTLPVYGAIGLYALGLRIGQYGWTSERVFAVTICSMLTIAAFAYAIGVLRPRAQWFAALPRINIALSLLTIAVIGALNSPLLDPHRIGVNDQLRRWQDGRTDAEHLGVRYLRFDSGRYGYRALQTLRSDPRIVADAALAESVQRMLERKAMPDDPQRPRSRASSADQLAARIRPARGSASPDPAMLQALLAEPFAAGNCVMTDSDCVTIDRDFDGDGRSDVLLCDLGMHVMTACALWTRSDEGRWERAANLTWYVGDDVQRVALALRNGEVEIKPRRWPDLIVDDRVATPSVVPELPSDASAREN